MWSAVSYFNGVSVSAAFAQDSDFLVVLKNGSIAAVASAPGATFPSFAIAELQTSVDSWDIFPQGRSLGSWLGLDAGLNAKRDLESDITVFSVGNIVFGGNSGAFSIVRESFS